jgi:hypothetical protein
MLRKIAFAALAAASLGVAALAPTSASAWVGPGWHGGWHNGWGGPRVVVVVPPITAATAVAASTGWSLPRGDHNGE